MEECSSETMETPYKKELSHSIDLRDSGKTRNDMQNVIGIHSFWLESSRRTHVPKQSIL